MSHPFVMRVKIRKHVWQNTVYIGLELLKKTFYLVTIDPRPSTEHKLEKWFIIFGDGVRPSVQNKTNRSKS